MLEVGPYDSGRNVAARHRQWVACSVLSQDLVRSVSGRFEFMVPIKIQCGCGQKYAFDAEPVNGRLASSVACPVCGTDGTIQANQMIARILGAQAPPPVPATRLRTVAATAVGSTDVVPRPAAPVVKQTASSDSADFSLGRGVLGAFIGAVIGIGAMYAFFEFAGFRFPLLGVGIGILTGIGARMLGRGTDSSLGYISGAIALISVVGTLFLMYGSFPMLNIISVAVSVSAAYRISSG